jgi:hypothetical protein
MCERAAGVAGLLRRQGDDGAAQLPLPIDDGAVMNHKDPHLVWLIVINPVSHTAWLDNHALTLQNIMLLKKTILCILS